MVEPLPYHHEPGTGKAKLLDDEDALLRAVASTLMSDGANGDSAPSANTWRTSSPRRAKSAERAELSR